MRTFLLSGALVALIAAGFSAPGLFRAGGVKLDPLSHSEAIARVRESFSQLEVLNEIPCPTFLQGRNVFCYASKATPEKLIEVIEPTIQIIAERIFGWRQDYGLWVAHYQLVADNHYIFGVNIGLKELDHRLLKDKSMEGYTSLLALTVDE
ncbi:hypothetical protein [Calidithermus chliarophilus]|uniref:hypothetical protein n=1 Tax=Calidithermus chliarophilus TaxID=52023 RepID=UPI0012F6FCCB|nr:hypothetical protein [Calidithermus chliarophilus]